MSQEELNKQAEWLTFTAVKHIIGKKRTTIHELVKDGTFEKIGRYTSARISLKSVLAYLEKQRGIAEVARTVPNATMQKSIAWARQKKAEQRLARAVELVNEGQQCEADAVAPVICESGTTQEELDRAYDARRKKESDAIAAEIEYARRQEEEKLTNPCYPHERDCVCVQHFGLYGTPKVAPKVLTAGKVFYAEYEGVGSDGVTKLLERGFQRTPDEPDDTAAQQRANAFRQGQTRYSLRRY